MTSATATLTEIAAFWRNARRLYTIYSELNRTFEIGLPLCNDLEYPIDRSEPEVIERVRLWLEQMDGRVQVWQLRQLLQSTNLQTEENLRALVQRYVSKPQKTEMDRDKIDFLFVQYFAHCGPQGPYEQQLSLAEVARVLEPILPPQHAQNQKSARAGSPEMDGVPTKFPDWAEGLDTKLDALNQCNSLEELQQSGALVDVRELKLSLGEGYLESAALVVFTRFNFLARRAFFRAMHLDLHAIRIALNELESRGLNVINCTEAGLTQQESLEHIRHVIHQWKTPFRAPYTGGNSFLQLVSLRHVLEAAAAKAKSPQQPPEPPAAPKAAPAVTKAESPEPPPPKKEPPATPAPAPVKEPVPAPPKKEPPSPAPAPVKEPAPHPPAASKAAREVSKPAVKEEETRSERDSYLEQCIGDITRQIMAAPPKHGASVTPIVLAGCKLLIATWEAEAFTNCTDGLSEALQRAVAARTILHVCVQRHKKNEPTDLFVALEIAHLAVEDMRDQVARAKEAKNIDAAVNLAATTKRLLALIAEGEKLCK
jgi:hypothetical protein